MKVAIVAAVDHGNGIGNQGGLPWGRPIASDMAHFRRLTKGCAVIMGRKTYESLPGPLVHRTNIVITSARADPCRTDQAGFCVAYALDHALNIAEFQKARAAFIIGGGMVYAEAIKNPRVETIYLTRVPYQYECDTYFPYIGDHWRLRTSSFLGSGVVYLPEGKEVECACALDVYERW